MMYPFCKYEDETEVVFSDIKENEKGEEVIYIHFERPTEDGFDSVRFELPTYNIVYKEGNYTEEEIEMFRKIVELCGYKIYFWSNENNEPIHIHISKGKPSAISTKIWLTKSGGCIVANNNSRIPNKDLNTLMEVVTSNYFFIVSQWKNFNQVEDVKFYC